MIKKLILDKVRWARGGEEDTQLLNRKGQMCCLGYCMLQEGVSPNHISELGTPEDVYDYHDNTEDNPVKVPYLYDSYYDPERECTRFFATRLSSAAMTINDDERTTDEQKLEALNSHFSAVGIEVVLVDTPEEVEALGGVTVSIAQ